jgi:formyl-CoA transferase
MENITMIYQSTGRLPQRIGNRYESTYPYDTFPASDGDVVIAAGNNKLFSILCDVMGKPELTKDPLYAEVKDRVANHAPLREIVSAWSKQYTIDEIDKMLNDAGCPACAVNTLDRLVKDPQIAGARGMFPEIDQPGIGKLEITAIPQKLTRTKARPRKAAPLLGEDNAAVYGEMLGFDEAKLAELKAKGVI